jgi:hypothetical protein
LDPPLLSIPTGLLVEGCLVRVAVTSMRSPGPTHVCCIRPIERASIRRRHPIPEKSKLTGVRLRDGCSSARSRAYARWWRRPSTPVPPERRAARCARARLRSRPRWTRTACPCSAPTRSRAATRPRRWCWRTPAGWTPPSSWCVHVRTVRSGVSSAHPSPHVAICTLSARLSPASPTPRLRQRARGAIRVWVANPGHSSGHIGLARYRHLLKTVRCTDPAGNVHHP